MNFHREVHDGTGGHKCIFRTAQAVSRGQKPPKLLLTQTDLEAHLFCIFFSHTLRRKKCVRYAVSVTQCTIVSVTHDIRLRLAEFRAEMQDH